MSVFRILRVVGAAILFLVVNVLVSVACVAVYAYLVNPGQTSEFYEEFAKLSSPYSSVLAGMPLMFVWCWWLSRKWEFMSIMGVWIVYSVIDIAVLSISGWTPRLAAFSAVSLATKLAAAMLGARFGTRFRIASSNRSPSEKGGT